MRFSEIATVIATCVIPSTTSRAQTLMSGDRSFLGATVSDASEPERRRLEYSYAKDSSASR